MSARCARENPYPFRRPIGAGSKLSSKIATPRRSMSGELRSSCSPPMGSARTRSCGEPANPRLASGAGKNGSLKKASKACFATRRGPRWPKSRLAGRRRRAAARHRRARRREDGQRRPEDRRRHRAQGDPGAGSSDRRQRRRQRRGRGWQAADSKEYSYGYDAQTGVTDARKASYAQRRNKVKDRARRG